ncbi:baseplate J/gp47 family protein [Flexibacterium corallicola]|uniref:baseplate J/gp47 family protein n=1 Tax=Flexibacterium corallicola TaxID=3037259 RepID=UPI00286F0DE5|nr:baseplate J/gp47 family protein [Pseudovibrio sp. M1P-2-3]
MAGLIKTLSPKDLISRGAPKLFYTHSSEWKAKLVDWFENAEEGPKRKLYPAQNEMVLIDMLSYCFSLLGRQAQEASEKRWLLFSHGHDLDVGAANNSTFRLLASPAVCLLEFTLEAVSITDTIIPKGTLVASGSEDALSFALDEDLTIPAGALNASGQAAATVTGTRGNGFVAGQLTTLANPVSLAGVTVSNITETSGGAEEESDSALIERAASAHDRISKAGPRESYRQQTRAFSPAIIDVEVLRPEPGHIAVYPLLEAGIGSDEFHAGLYDWLDFEEKRPQGDDLAILAPEAVSFAITGTAKVRADELGNKQALEGLITEAASIWSRSLGDYLALSALTCAARSLADLVDIELELNGLSSRQLSPVQFAVLTSIDLEVELVNG